MVVPPNRLRFGNVLLRGRLLRELSPPFDPAYGLTGGEDGDLLSRLALAGSRIVWCDEAIVREPIERARLSLAWLLRRSLRGGQDYARHSLAGRYGPQSMGRFRLLVRALLQLIAAAGLTVLALPLGRHRAAHWLTKASANLGKLSVFLGWHYREYA
jgi:succinoglycan biosynthesis protein ExoM